MERTRQSEIAATLERHAWASTVLVAAPPVLAVQSLGRYWLAGGEELARLHALTLAAILSLGLVASLLRGLRGARPLGVAPTLLALAPLVLLAPEAIPLRYGLLVPLGGVAGLALALLVHALRSVRADARLRLAEATAWCAACAVLASWLVALQSAS